MNKRWLGNLLKMIGYPSTVATTAMLSALPRRSIGLVVAVPCAILTLPFLPFAVKGEKIVSECNIAEFKERTKALPRVVLPKHYAYIEKHPDDNGEWIVQPYHYENEEEPFSSEAEARLFLETLQYHEVISLDTARNQTFWIKGKYNGKAQS